MDAATRHGSRQMSLWVKIADKVLISLIAIILMIPVVVVVIFPAYNMIFATEVARYESPDGRHVIVLRKVPGHIGRPGASNQVPGYVVLEDSSGKMLESMEIDMINLLKSIHWEHEYVVVNESTQWPR